VLEAFLNPLGDFDFAFASQEFDRAHFAHVHAHRVSRAAKFGIDRRQRGFSFFCGIFVGYRRRRVRHQHFFGIGRFVADLNTHIGDHADHAFDLLSIEHVFRQMVVDFRVSEIAALFAEHDQLFEFLLANFRINLLGRLRPVNVPEINVFFLEFVICSHLSATLPRE